MVGKKEVHTFARSEVARCNAFTSKSSDSLICRRIVFRNESANCPSSGVAAVDLLSLRAIFPSSSMSGERASFGGPQLFGSEEILCKETTYQGGKHTLNSPASTTQSRQSPWYGYWQIPREPERVKVRFS